MLQNRPLIAIAIGLVGVLAAVSSVAAQTDLMSTTLLGSSEKPDSGEPTGFGIATINLNAEVGYICYSLYTSKIASPTAAHIHKGKVNEAGPVVVPFTTPAKGSASGCVDADKNLIRDIQANPSAYYVNVHNANYPKGALRGQLGK